MIRASIDVGDHIRIVGEGNFIESTIWQIVGFDQTGRRVRLELVSPSSDDFDPVPVDITAQVEAGLVEEVPE